jgi:hypothetical protein
LEPAMRIFFYETVKRIRMCYFLHVLGCIAAHAIMLFGLCQILLHENEANSKGCLIAGSIFFVSHVCTVILQGIRNCSMYGSIHKWAHHVVSFLIKTDTPVTREWRALKSIFLLNICTTAMIGIWYFYMVFMYLTMVHYMWITCGMLVLFGWNLFMHICDWSIGREFQEEWWAQTQNQECQCTANGPNI